MKILENTFDPSSSLRGEEASLSDRTTWNQSKLDYPQCCIHELVQAQSICNPETLAVISHNAQLTFKELDRQADACALRLREMGVGPEMTVGVFLHRTPNLVVGLLGILKAGAAYVPLDPGYPPARLQTMLETSRLSFLLTETSLAPQLEAFAILKLCIDQLTIPTDPVRLPQHLHPEQIAYVLYTSGSTGMPKGVAVTHRSVVNCLKSLARLEILRRGEIFLATTTISFDIAAAEIFLPLTIGATVFMASRLDTQQVDRFANLILESGAAVVQATPSAWEALIRTGYRPSGIRLLCAGEVLTSELSRLLISQGCELWNLYGPTETTIYATYHRVSSASNPTVPIGMPIANTDVYVLNDSLQTVPEGASGELYIAGAALARGYFGRGDLTAEAFIPNPFGQRSGDRLYRTGDQVKLCAGGELEFLGRHDGQVKIRGYRIELAEIEAVLRQHSEVDQIVTIVREDTPGNKRLVAYFVPRRGVENYAGDPALVRDYAQRWQGVFDHAYKGPSTILDADRGLNAAGWNSSYTGRPLDVLELRDWVEQTVKRVRGLKPQRILELGCGTGLILLSLAQDCVEYVGVDPVASGLDFIRKQIRGKSEYQNVSLLHQDALSALQECEKQFDIVLMNSVVQYFPGPDYFIQALELCSRAVRDGGYIYIGDVRNLALLETFHLSIELKKDHPDNMSTAELRELVQQYSLREKELCIDPRFFHAWAECSDRVKNVELWLRRSKYQNEFTKYRYDAVLQAGPPQSCASNVPVTDWPSENLDLGKLEELLSVTRPSEVKVTNIPNARIQEDVRALALLTANPSPSSLGKVRESRKSSFSPVSPDALYELADKYGYRLALGWSGSGRDGGMDAILHQNGLRAFGTPRLHTLTIHPWREYMNDPLGSEGWSRLARQLRAYARERLPEYMVPAAFVPLTTLPLTPNGKVDKKRLSLPGSDRPELDQSYVAASNSAERLLASIWSDVLRVDKIGIYDSFFDLGGHSLLGMQVISRVQSAFGVTLPLKCLFDAPRILDLASCIDSEQHREIRSAVPIEKKSRTAALPLSYAQQRLWFLSQLEQDKTFYNIPNLLWINGKLQLEPLTAALNEIIKRHESLRTGFVEVNGRPMEIVHEPKQIELEMLDLTEHSEAGRKAQVQSLADSEVQKAFDLTEPPLMRVKLLRLGAEEHVLLLTMHHIVSDAWSMAVLTRELGILYEAFRQGKESPLEELEIQYGDYAMWQREWLKGEVLEGQMEYWRKQLAGMPEVLELAVGGARPAVRRAAGGQYRFEVSKELLGRIKEVGRRESATLFMTLLAGFQVLLWKYSGQRDVVVGSPIAGRTRKETEGLIGFFVNTLVLRTKIGGEQSFSEVVRQVREVALEAYANQDVPFEKLVEELQPERDLSRTPLFQVMFVLQNAQEVRWELPGLTFEQGEFTWHHSGFDLLLQLTERDQKLEAVINYQKDLFTEEMMARMAKHLQVLLQGMASDPGTRIGELGLLSEEERSQILVEWNETAREYPREKCVQELFEEQVERTPEALAVVFEGKSLSYRELNQKANRIAHYLRQLGVGPETRVGICMERSPDLIATLLGILKAGAAYVPLDPGYPQERLAFMLEDAAIPVVLQSGSMPTSPIPLHQNCRFIDIVQTDLDEFCPSPLSKLSCSRNAAYMIYTSGSTGRPKGTVIEHRSVVALLYWSRQTYSLQDMSGVLATTSICFDLSVFEIFAPLSWGGTIILAVDALHMPSFREELKITLINTVPSVMHELLKSDLLPQQPYTINLAGEPLMNDVVQQLYKRGSVRRLFNLYGPTEDTTYSTSALLDQIRSGRVPIGKPIANTRAYVLDANLRELPIGVPGELYLGGDGLARGYWNRPDSTAEKFVPDPFSRLGGERLYRTGDFVCWNTHGELTFLSRADSQIKLRGYRIELEEIENVLRQDDNVEQAAVLVHEIRPGDKTLVAYVATSDGQGLKKIAKRLSTRLPAYMVPDVWIPLKELPLNANGKLDRKQLPKPHPEELQARKGYARPSTGIEEVLAAIWSDVLSLKDVGISDNFFALGGHSLLAMRVISRIRTHCGIEISVQQLFKYPTIAALAEVIELESKKGHQLHPIRRVEDRCNLPLSWAQQRLWFLYQFEEDKSLYNVPMAIRLSGSLNGAALEAALNEIIARHEILRASFQDVQGKPILRVQSVTTVKVDTMDLLQKDAGEREQELRNAMRQQGQKAFDLAEPPLMRVKLLRLGAEEHVLLLTMHHIVSDAWSMAVLMRELGVLYEAFRQGKESPLEELEIQYGDYAVWQREWLKGEVLEGQMEYWRKQLAGMPEVLELPLARPRPETRSSEGGQYRFQVSGEVLEGLRSLGRRETATLFMTLLAGFQILLYRYSGQEDVVVGSPIAGRNRKETEELIGFFVNTLVLRRRVKRRERVVEAVRGARETALGGYANQDVPFEKVVEELQPERDLSRTPLFQIMLVLQNAGEAKWELPGLVLKQEEVELTVEKFDLTLDLVEKDRRLDAVFTYRKDMLEAETMERMGGHLQVLLRGMVEGPEQGIGELPLMSRQEQEQVLEEWNRTAREYAENRCVHELFEEQAERRPQATAVVYEEQELSYRELNERANQLAHYLRKLGAGPEVRVGICMERSLEMIVALLGILKVGGAYVPLDPTYPPERLNFMIGDAGVKLVLSQSSFPAFISATVNVLCLDKNTEALLSESNENLNCVVSPANLLYVIYTSGSTGNPKGVAMTHGALANLIQWQLSSFSEPAKATLQYASLSFDVSFQEIFSSLADGGVLYLLGEYLKTDFTALSKFIRERNVERIFLPFIALNQLCSSEHFHETPGPWKEIITAGEQLQVSSSIKKIFSLNRGKLINHYGPSETHVVTVHTLAGVPEQWPSLPPIGRPIANIKAYVLDEDMRPVSPGIAGELYLSGRGLSRGYLNRPEFTAEKFVPNPFTSVAGERLYRSGDRARWSSRGELEFLGRLDGQVKIRGYRIELGEIESRLRCHEKVSQAAAIVHETAGGDRRLIVYVTSRSGEPLDEGCGFKDYLRQWVPEYMIPVMFIQVDNMPLTPSGKLDRKRLPPPELHPPPANTYVAPTTATEEILSEILSSVLEVPRVGTEDNFFHLSGHSLLAMQVISRIREMLFIDIPVRSIFEAPTVAELAKVVTALEPVPGQVEKIAKIINQAGVTVPGCEQA